MVSLFLILLKGTGFTPVHLNTGETVRGGWRGGLDSEMFPQEGRDGWPPAALEMGCKPGSERWKTEEVVQGRSCCAPLAILLLEILSFTALGERVWCFQLSVKEVQSIELYQAIYQAPNR